MSSPRAIRLAESLLWKTASLWADVITFRPLQDTQGSRDCARWALERESAKVRVYPSPPLQPSATRRRPRCGPVGAVPELRSRFCPGAACLELRREGV
jgi:hypothetical protein